MEFPPRPHFRGPAPPGGFVRHGHPGMPGQGQRPPFFPPGTGPRGPLPEQFAGQVRSHYFIHSLYTFISRF